MISDEEIRHRNGKRSESNLALLSKGLFVLLINVRLSDSSSISHRLFNRDVSSFCVREECTVAFLNGTSTALPLTEFYYLMAEYARQKGNVYNKNDLDLNLNLDERNVTKNSTEKNENTYDDEIIQTSFAPATETNATEPTPYDVDETEAADKNLAAACTDKYGNPIIDSSGRLMPADGGSKATTPSYNNSSATSHTVRTTPEIDYDYDSEEKEKDVEKLSVQLSEEEIEKARKMTECAKKKVENDITCICNSTYCDKFIPPEKTPEWTYTWYTTSKEGLRFRKQRNKMTPYEEDEEGAFYVNTSRKYQKIIGFGGAFTDAACQLIKHLSKATRKNLLESYFGPFGINYNLGRVPIGGTDLSPRFYTYMDFEDNSTSNFMLTEQDFKYKIPIILQVMNLTRNQLKLVGCAWTAPLWMKTEPIIHSGSLKREYWSLWAEYHIRFLDQYQTSGVKFWALSAGNEPMNYHYITTRPFINAMEWSPYEQSQWVGHHLSPMLKNSSHKEVLILGMEENREYIEFYMKYFYEDYQLKYFDDLTYANTNRAIDSIDGVAIHGYMDYDSNTPYLERTREMNPDKFLLYTEFCCWPESRGWPCAELYATQIITALNNWATGWIDWNLALDSKGGPSYLDVTLLSPIIVDVKRNEFRKEPVFYIMGHFSIFLLPGSHRIKVGVPNGLENIYAAAVHRPDDGKVIIIYNKFESDKQVTFLIDKKYKLSLEVPAKSVNSVLFW